MLSGEVKDVLLLDVTPLSLGIETLGGVFTWIIDRNTTIPTKKSQVFSTAEDSQSAVTIRVFQGERELAAQNKMLGLLDLVGIPPARAACRRSRSPSTSTPTASSTSRPRTRPPARSSRSGIQASGGLSEAEVEKMVAEAAEHAEEDKKRKAVIEAKNHADSLIYSTDRSLKEHGDKVPASTRPRSRGDGRPEGRARQRGRGRHPRKTDALAQVSMKLGEAMYKAQQEAGGGGTPGDDAGGGRAGGARAGGEGVVDAEFEEVDDERKRSA